MSEAEPAAKRPRLSIDHVLRGKIIKIQYDRRDQRSNEMHVFVRTPDAEVYCKLCGAWIHAHAVSKTLKLNKEVSIDLEASPSEKLPATREHHHRFLFASGIRVKKGISDVNSVWKSFGQQPNEPLAGTSDSLAPTMTSVLQQAPALMHPIAPVRETNINDYQGFICGDRQYIAGKALKPAMRNVCYMGVVSKVLKKASTYSGDFAVNLALIDPSRGNKEEQVGIVCNTFTAPNRSQPPSQVEAGHVFLILGCRTQDYAGKIQLVGGGQEKWVWGSMTMDPSRNPILKPPLGHELSQEESLYMKKLWDWYHINDLAPETPTRNLVKMSRLVPNLLFSAIVQMLRLEMGSYQPAHNTGSIILHVTDFTENAVFPKNENPEKGLIGQFVLQLTCWDHQAACALQAFANMQKGIGSDLILVEKARVKWASLGSAEGAHFLEAALHENRADLTEERITSIQENEALARDLIHARASYYKKYPPKPTANIPLQPSQIHSTDIASVGRHPVKLSTLSSGKWFDAIVHLISGHIDSYDNVTNKGRATLLVTDYTENQLFPENTNAYPSKGPIGRQTLSLTCWDGQVEVAQAFLELCDNQQHIWPTIKICNAKAKISKYDTLEADVRSDPIHVNSVQLLKVAEADQAFKELKTAADACRSSCTMLLAKSEVGTQTAQKVTALGILDAPLQPLADIKNELPLNNVYRSRLIIRSVKPSVKTQDWIVCASQRCQNACIGDPKTCRRVWKFALIVEDATIIKRERFDRPSLATVIVERENADIFLGSAAGLSDSRRMDEEMSSRLRWIFGTKGGSELEVTRYAPAFDATLFLQVQNGNRELRLVETSILQPT